MNFGTSLRPVCCAVAALVLTSAPARADTLLASTVSNGFSYQLWQASKGITWSYAEEAAVRTGGHLASIHSADENSLIYSLIAPHIGIMFEADPTNQLGPWIGGVKDGDRWTWSDGSDFTYANWTAGQPDNWGGLETRIHFLAPGTDPVDTPGEGAQWNDYLEYGTVAGYVVKVAQPTLAPQVPEPATWVSMVIGFGAIGYAARSRKRSTTSRTIA
jgi:hypothetical protein